MGDLAKSVASMPGKILETCADAFKDALDCGATGTCGETCDCKLLNWMKADLKLDKHIHKLSQNAIKAAHKVGGKVSDAADEFQDWATDNLGKAVDQVGASVGLSLILAVRF